MVRGVLKTPGASHETAKKGAGWTPPLRGLASWQLDLKSAQNFFSEQNKSSWIGGFFLANFQVKTHQKFKNGIFGHFDPLFKYFFLARLYFTRPARGGGADPKCGWELLAGEKYVVGRAILIQLKNLPVWSTQIFSKRTPHVCSAHRFWLRSP